MPPPAPRLRVRLVLLLAPAWALAAEPRDPARLVAEHCVTCHNQNLVGSPAPNLVDPLWTHGGSDEAMTALNLAYEDGKRKEKTVLRSQDGANIKEESASCYNCKTRNKCDTFRKWRTGGTSGVVSVSAEQDLVFVDAKDGEAANFRLTVTCE